MGSRGPLPTAAKRPGAPSNLDIGKDQNTSHSRCPPAEAAVAGAIEPVPGQKLIQKLGKPFVNVCAEPIKVRGPGAAQHPSDFLLPAPQGMNT
jgi:hypothetical protein